MSKEQRKEIESYIQLLVYAESYEQNRKDIETIRELRRNALKYLFDGYKSIKGSKLSLSLFPLIKGKPIAKLKFLKPKIKPEMGCNERIEKKYIKDCDEGKGKKKKEKLVNNGEENFSFKFRIRGQLLQSIQIIIGSLEISLIIHIEKDFQDGKLA